MKCVHEYGVAGYNASIVIEECRKCGHEKEYDFDDYVAKNGFPYSEEGDK